MDTASPPPVPAAAAPGDAQLDEHLRLLGIFHYVVAGMIALFALFPAIHLVLGIMMVTGRMTGQDEEAAFVGWLFIGIGAAAIALGQALAVAVAYAGRCLRRRRRHTLCLVVAGIECMMVPFGTVLGVLTLIALTKPQAKAQFS